jgi:hypothetical protein
MSSSLISFLVGCFVPILISSLALIYKYQRYSVFEPDSVDSFTYVIVQFFSLLAFLIFPAILTSFYLELINPNAVQNNFTLIYLPMERGYLLGWVIGCFIAFIPRRWLPKNLEDRKIEAEEI